METYYIAQYGSGDYNESTYGDTGTDTGTGTGLTDTGIGPLPGIIVGTFMIIASLFLLVKRSKRNKD